MLLLGSPGCINDRTVGNRTGAVRARCPDLVRFPETTASRSREQEASPGKRCCLRVASQSCQSAGLPARYPIFDSFDKEGARQRAATSRPFLTVLTKRLFEEPLDQATLRLRAQEPVQAR